MSAHTLKKLFFEQLPIHEALLELISKNSFQCLTFRPVNGAPTEEYTDPKFWTLLGYPSTTMQPRSDYVVPASAFNFERSLQTDGEFRIRYRRHDGFDQLIRTRCFHLSIPTTATPFQLQLHQLIPVEEPDSVYSQILNAVGASVVVLDIDLRVTFWNNRAEEIFGFKTEEVIGKSLPDKLIPEKLQQDAQAIMRDLKNGQNWQGEFQMSRKDGSMVTLLVVNRPIFNNHREIIGYVGVSTDISEQKQVQAQLDVVRKRMQLAINTGKIGVCEQDLRTGTLEWNDQKLNIYGISRATFEEDTSVWRSLVHPEDLKIADAKLSAAMQGEVVENIRFRIRTPAGQIKHIYASATPLYDQKGQISKIIGVNIDVSRLANLEAAEQMARELTIRNQEIEQFVSIASHDLQEPLRTMSGFAQLLNRRFRADLPSEAHYYVDYIAEAANRLGRLVRGLIDYNRLGRDIDREKVNTESLLKNILLDLAASIEAHQADVRLGYLPTIEAYSDELRQLFQNLISNALKFHRAGQPPTVEIQAVAQGNGYTFTVQDNGIGIGQADQDRIFEMFRRLHPDHTSSGDGIGLAYCKKIVGLHDGQIHVESEPGRGTTFFVFLPQPDPFLRHGTTGEPTVDGDPGD